MIRRYHLHIPGLVYLAIVVLIGVAAMNNQNNLLFWVFGVMVSGLVLSGLVSAWMLMRLTVRRIDPQHGAVGEPLIVRYAVTNRSRILAVFNIHIEERTVPHEMGWQRLMSPARAWMMHLGGRETIHGEAFFWPSARGEVRFNQMRIWTTFPFGLVKKSITFSQPQHTLIYPMIYELNRSVLSAVTPAGSMGVRLTTRSGAGDDFYGVREHRAGDSMRHISWKRTARTDELVVIERTNPSPPKLRVVLNLLVATDALRVGLQENVTPRELEERSISLVASILHAADLQGFEVGLTVLGTGLPPLPVRRNQWHLSKIMATLAAIDLDAPRRSLEAGTAPIRDAERAGLIVVTPDRSDPLPGRDDALYLTGRNLQELAVRAIGWDAGGAIQSEPRSMRAHRGAAA